MSERWADPIPENPRNAERNYANFAHIGVHCHEFGHALGLAHSTAPEDLMYPTIETNFPYISECDIDAMKALYDGGNTSEVICRS